MTDSYNGLDDTDIFAVISLSIDMHNMHLDSMVEQIDHLLEIINEQNLKCGFPKVTKESLLEKIHGLRQLE